MSPLTPLMALLGVLALCAYIVRKEGSQGLRNFATILKVFAFYEVLKALASLFKPPTATPVTCSATGRSPPR